MSVDNIFPIKTLCELAVANETRVLDRPGPKPNKPFPHQNDAIYIYIYIYMFASVNRRTTHKRTDAVSSPILLTHLVILRLS